MSEQPTHSPEDTSPTKGETEDFSIEALKEDTRRRKAARAREQQKTSDAIQEFHRSFAQTATTGEEVRRLDVDIGVVSVGAHSKQKPRNEDTVLHDQTLQLFGVFDGMGGYDNGDVASSAAALAVHDYYLRQATQPISKEEALAQAQEAMDSAREAVVRTRVAGGTTAVFGKVEHIQGIPYVIWGNAGDSRFFMQERPEAPIASISTDQSRGNYVFNGLYARLGSIHDMPDEFGIVPLVSNNRLLFCSDGITGDTAEQTLDDQEMQWAFEAATPQEAAMRLVSISKKHDDKSAVVIDAHEEITRPEPGDANKRTNPPATLWPVISPSMRSAYQEKNLRHRISRRYRRAKKTVQVASATVGVAAVKGFHKTQEHFRNPEKGTSRRRAIIAGAAGALALFAAYKFGLFDSLFGGNGSKPPSSTPDHDLRPPHGNTTPEPVQPSTPSRPSNPPAESVQPPKLRLGEDDTIWGESAKYLQTHGYSPTDVNVDLVKDAVLRHQNITEFDATRLPVGYRFTIPPEVLEKLNK